MKWSFDFDDMQAISDDGVVVKFAPSDDGRYLDGKVIFRIEKLPTKEAAKIIREAGEGFGAYLENIPSWWSLRVMNKKITQPKMAEIAGASLRAVEHRVSPPGKREHRARLSMLRGS